MVYTLWHVHVAVVYVHTRNAQQEENIDVHCSLVMRMYSLFHNNITPKHTHTDIEKYHSIDDYEAEEEDEISFPKGIVVDVMQKRLDGWWFVKYEDKTGLAPATFLRKGQPPAKPNLVGVLHEL